MATKTPLKRPYATLYYALKTDKTPSFSAHGACKSEQGAIRASIVRIWMKEYQRIRCVDRELDIVLWEVWLGDDGLIRQAWGREVPERMQQRHMRRVK